MYEESQQANTRLSDDLTKVRTELVSSKKKFEEAMKVIISVVYNYVKPLKQLGTRKTLFV